jgi:3-oxoadipate enol-lactonase
MKTIVFVHGFGSSSRAWAPQLGAFAGRYRLLAPDLPGHGSEAAEPFTFARAVAGLRESIDDAEAVYLVGVSGGAAVAVLTALADRGRVAGLVLSGGFAHAPKLFALQRALMTIMPWRMYTTAAQGFYSGGTRDYAKAAREDLERCGKAALLAMLREIAHLDVRDRLGEIAAPTLVLCGANDRANIPGSRELAAGIPGAELRIVPGANHFWNLQQPELFNRTIDQFVEAH